MIQHFLIGARLIIQITDVLSAASAEAHVLVPACFTRLLHASGCLYETLCHFLISELFEGFLMKIAHQVFIQTVEITRIGIPVGFNHKLGCASAKHAALVRHLSMRHTVQILKQIDAVHLSFSHLFDPLIKEGIIEIRVCFRCQSEDIRAFMEAGKAWNQLDLIKPVLFVKAEQSLGVL